MTNMVIVFLVSKNNSMLNEKLTQSWFWN